MSGTAIVTDNASPVLTREEVCRWTRVDAQSETQLLDLLQRAAMASCEGATGLTLARKTLRMSVDRLRRRMTLPTHPLGEVLSVTVYGRDDEANELDADEDYFVDDARRPARIVMRRLGGYDALRPVNAVEIEFTAGWTSPDHVPPDIKTGLLQHIAFLYDQRGDMKNPEQSAPPGEIMRLYQPHRIYGVSGAV